MFATKVKKTLWIRKLGFENPYLCDEKAQEYDKKSIPFDSPFQFIYRFEG